MYFVYVIFSLRLVFTSDGVGVVIRSVLKALRSSENQTTES